MIKRPPEKNKKIASELAKLIMSGSMETEQTRNLRKGLGLKDPNSKIRDRSPRSWKEDGAIDNESIGIWKPEWINGQKFYTRDPAKINEWNFWARTQKIPPKSSAFRIVFLGESVARGTFFDPEYTPAKALETLLNSNGLNSEVIDLARTDIGCKDLSLLANSCIHLQPDSLVIFSGNNWLNDIVLSNGVVEEILRELDTGSRFDGIKKMLENKYAGMVSSFIEHIADLSESKKIPVLIIIPEYNLLDWHCNETERIPIFPGDELGEWYRLKEKVERYIGNGNSNKAEKLCEKMITLNSANPYSHELLARCKLERKMYKEAVEYLRLAHDTVIFRRDRTPGIVSIIRESLIKFAEQHGIPVIDLPVIFNKYLGGKPPGRRLFMDYCHLTAEGIKIVVGHVGQYILGMQVDKLKINDLEPDNDLTARAHFLAAIHNAHWGQSKEILYYHCLQALKLSPQVKEIMTRFAVMASRHSPWIISRELGEIYSTGITKQYNIIQEDGGEIMDIALVDAIASALKQSDVDINDKIRKLRTEEHGFIKGKINLLESYYHLSYYSNPNRESGYFKAFTPQSKLFFVAEKPAGIVLDITYRVPVKKIDDEVLRIKVNEQAIQELPVCEDWLTEHMAVPAEFLVDGINNIVIQWPMLENNPENLKKENESPFEFLQRRMRPIYGEIHTFHVVKR